MRRKHLTYTLAFSLLLGSFIALIAYSQQKPVAQLRAEMNNASHNLYKVEIPRHKVANDLLNEMIDSVKRKYNTLTGITVSTAPAGDYISVSHRAASAISVIKTSYTLSENLKQSLIDLEKQREIAENLWAIDVDNAYVAFENAIEAYNSHPHVSPGEHEVVSAPIKPHVNSLYDCQGPCYVVFETLPLAMYSHSKTCYEKHGASGSSWSYWSCEYNVCPAGNTHWKECRASACSDLFPPPEHEHTYDYWDHKVKCTECGEEYYTCQHSSCPKSNTHRSSSNPIVTPPPPPMPSPTYHACGEHETSVSGDHSLQASCSSTDSNGNYCTVTNFYACDSHTHSYPAPPPPPTTVSCARAACGEQVSDRLKHRVDNCSNCNAVYWTCYPDAIYDHETTFTCRRSGCGATFTRCSNTPTSCQSENYHWAQD